jgi:hypothetical protein
MLANSRAVTVRLEPEERDRAPMARSSPPAQVRCCRLALGHEIPAESDNASVLQKPLSRQTVVTTRASWTQPTAPVALLLAPPTQDPLDQARRTRLAALPDRVLEHGDASVCVDRSRDANCTPATILAGGS